MPARMAGLSSVAVSVLLTVTIIFLSEPVLCTGHAGPQGCQNRDEYYELHHVCKSSCTDSNDCRDAEQCVCDGICGPSCVDVGQTPSCLPPPQSPSNGLSWLTPPRGSNSPGGFGTTVHFSCNGDARMVGSAETTCMSSGRWGDDPPYCIRTDEATNCRVPVDLENASIEVSGDQTEARYTCHHGFTGIGRSTIVCIPGVGWEPVAFECKAMKCGTPGEPSDGSLTSLDFRYGSTVGYRCRTSYSLVGVATRTCTNGTWDADMPACIAQRCAPPDAAGVSVTLSSDNLLIGTVASFRCLLGYELQGSDSAVCLDDLTWSNPPPTCEVTTCARPDIVTAALSYSDASDQRSVFNFDETIEYECPISGQMLHGDGIRRCGEGGRWSGEEPSCHALCSQLPAVISGGSSFNVPSDSLYNWHGGQKIYFCDDYSTMSGTSTFFCREGEWSSDDYPSCTSDHTSTGNSFPVRSLTHAIVDGVLRVKQREEEVLIDCRVATVFGVPQWRKDNQNPSGSQYTLRQYNRENRWYRLRLQNIAQSDAGLYQCTTIDRVGTSSLHLEVITTCVDPGYQEGRRTNRDTTGGVPAGRLGFVRFDCDEGYTMVGDYNQLGCDINGNWNHDPPDCVKPNCLNAQLVGPDNGQSTMEMLPDGSAVQIFQCDMGYRMVQADVQVTDLVMGCQDGVWNGTAPTCVQRENIIMLTVNGVAVGRELTAMGGDSLAIQCSLSGSDPQPRWFRVVNEEALDLGLDSDSGDLVLHFNALSASDAGRYECGEPDESYREAVDISVVARCSDPPEIPNGFIDPSTLRSDFYDSHVVKIECNGNFLLHGVSQLQCSAQGWSASFPQCVQDLTMSLYRNGHALGDGSIVHIASGSTLLLDCAVDGAGPQSIEGLAQAGVIGWSKLAPNGQRLSLEMYQRPVKEGNLNLLRLVLSNVTPDFFGQYVCGTVAEAVSIRLLVTVDCQIPPRPLNGILTLTNGRKYRSTASYRCGELYEPYGNTVRQCQSNGEWSGIPPNCTIAYCPALDLPNGATMLPDYTNNPVPVGTTVQFRCADTMVQSGSRDSTCTDDGTWLQPQGDPACTDPCLDFSCRLGWRCSLVAGGPACFSCLSESDCPTPSANGDSTVCGTDAQDYPNECILGMTSCLSGDLTLGKAFDGPCAHQSMCFLRPTTIGYGSPSPCPPNNYLFYYETDTKSVGCKVTSINECLPEGGFESIEYCQGNCSRNYCYDPPGERGPCSLSQTYYTYDSVTKHCQPFTYGGCGGTQNRFETLNDCIRSCFHQEICPPCPMTMTLGNACFYGKHGMILTVSKLERFARSGYIRYTVDIQSVLTPARPGGIDLQPEANQRVFYETQDQGNCACPRLLPLVDQPYLFVSSTYRGQNLKLDMYSYVAEWTTELENQMMSTGACGNWITRLNRVP